MAIEPDGGTSGFSSPPNWAARDSQGDICLRIGPARRKRRHYVARIA